MTAGPLAAVRNWLTTAEAAEWLSNAVGDRSISEAYVLRLALEESLPLCVYLPDDTAADCWEISEEQEAHERAQTITIEWMNVEPTDRERISRVWELPMVPPVSIQVHQRINVLDGLEPPVIEHAVGAVVQRGRTRCRLVASSSKYAAPASALPKGTQFVVMRTDLEEFVKAHMESPLPLEAPVGDRERQTLYMMIAALAKHGKLNLSEHYKVGGVIHAIIKEQFKLDKPKSQAIALKLKEILSELGLQQHFP